MNKPPAETNSSTATPPTNQPVPRSAEETPKARQSEIEWIRIAAKRAAAELKAGKPVSLPIPDDSWLYESENGNS